MMVLGNGATNKEEEKSVCGYFGKKKKKGPFVKERMGRLKEQVAAKLLPF